MLDMQKYGPGKVLDYICTIDLTPSIICYKRKVYKIAKKAVKEYNKISDNPCYFYVVKVIRAHSDSKSSYSTDLIEITIGLTTIKKSNIPQKYVIFPNLFESDKTLREDIAIRYIPKCSIWSGYSETIEFLPQLC